MKCKTWLNIRWRDVGWRDSTCFDVEGDMTWHWIALGMSKRKKLCIQHSSVTKVIVKGGVKIDRSVNALKNKKKSIALAWKQNVAWHGCHDDMTVTTRCRDFCNGSKHVVQPLWRSLDWGKHKSPLGIRWGTEACYARRIQRKFKARISRSKHSSGESNQNADKFVRKPGTVREQGESRE